MNRACVAALVVTCVTIGSASAFAQGWSVDVSAGHLVYDPLSASVNTGNLMGAVRYDSVHQRR